VFPIEKYDFENEEWLALGFTNSDGVFVDSDVSKPCQYRIGLKTGIVSQEFPGLYDLYVKKPKILIGNESRFAPGPKDQHKKVWAAERVIISPQTRVYVFNSGHLVIVANKVILNNSISGRYDTHAGVGQYHGGKVTIRVAILEGKGGISQKGSPGARGRKGVVGKNGEEKGNRMPSRGGRGSPGARGGNGGRILIEYFTSSKYTDSSQLNVQGGLGGAGGDGGAGGKIIYWSMPGAPVVYSSSGDQGSQGIYGANGKAVVRKLDSETAEYSIDELLLEQQLRELP